METSELLKKVRKIEIKTKGLSTQVFSGEYHSAFKGRGMAFSEVREYTPGDDIRTIDWNVTARFNTPFVKVFEEAGIPAGVFNLIMASTGYREARAIRDGPWSSASARTRISSCSRWMSRAFRRRGSCGRSTTRRRAFPARRC